jgi:hypothetical protein
METTLALDSFRRACDAGRGAVFFSVARGKVCGGGGGEGDRGRGEGRVFVGGGKGKGPGRQQNSCGTRRRDLQAPL